MIPTLSNISSVLHELNEEQRQLIASTEIAGRLPLLAQFRREREAETLEVLSKACGISVLRELQLVPHPAERLPIRLISEYQALPVQVEGASEQDLHLATLWPPSDEMGEWVYSVTGRIPTWHLAESKEIVNTITQHFGVGAADLDESASYEESGRPEEEAEDQDAALIRFVNEVIEKAIADRATDIHFEPLKETLQIRYRIDGELVPVRVPDNLVNFQSAIISRLKIMSRLNISEKRRPQDGRINFTGASSDLDIRLSTMPTMYGESVSLRLLNQKAQAVTIADLGFHKDDQDKVKHVLDLPHGIILVTGPTGSGKSTSLTAFIRSINVPGRRIITVEDPVEYEVPGVNQTQVNHEIGYDFASALRHILRQDPDVIMIGEIRDRETADIAIRAALTGHLVFSTLHTNDAPGAIARLTDMGIEPFLIASAVELIVAQRLVRRLCPHCKAPAPLDRRRMEGCLTALGVPLTPENLGVVPMGPMGCEHCRKLGFRGRLGLFEILRVNEDLHDLITQRAPASSLRQVALGKGMVTLQNSGWRHVKAGNTSFPEVMRYAFLDESES